MSTTVRLLLVSLTCGIPASSACSGDGSSENEPGLNGTSTEAARMETLSIPAEVIPAPADAKRLMLSVVEPAAERYWDAVGWILDSTGTQEIVPSTSEEWQEVVDAGWVVAESGYLLLMPGRTGSAWEDDPSWKAMAIGLVTICRRAVEAAESRDPLAVFNAGAELYQGCVACHAVYATETLRPNHDAGSTAGTPGGLSEDR